MKPATPPPFESPLLDAGPPTPLLDLELLAQGLGLGRVLVKDEGQRPLGNFKVLGGLTAGVRALARAEGTRPRRLICASDGNHGLAVAAAAASSGAEAWIFLPRHVSEARVARIATAGAQVVHVDGTYDDAVRAAHAAAATDGILVPDTTDDPDDPVVADVMAGYRRMTLELAAQLPSDAAPTHVFVQAGVGGLAAALAGGLAEALAQAPAVVVVEPAGAACVGPALRAGRPVQIEGDLQTCAEMLACGLASAPALEILRRHGAVAMTVEEAALAAAPAVLRAAGGPVTTPSGAAGLAGLMRAAGDPTLRARLKLGPTSCVLLVVTETGQTS